jgi:circadian clock protein KaiC
MNTDRVKTGIDGLDRMLSGGFMRGDAVIVVGAAGTGKSTIGLEYLVNGCTKFGENGIYLTFEQLPQQTYRDSKAHGWDLEALESAGKLRVICTSPEILLEDGGEGILDDPIKEINAKRIVIDSLSNIETFSKTFDIRREAYRILNHLKIKGLSSMSLWENPQLVNPSVSATEFGLSFLADCVVILRYVEIESTMRKAVMVMKMRGSEHDRQLREFAITQSGVDVMTPFAGYDSIMSGSPKKSLSDAAVDAWTRAFEKGKNRS